MSGNVIGIISLRPMIGFIKTLSMLSSMIGYMQWQAISNGTMLQIN